MLSPLHRCFPLRVFTGAMVPALLLTVFAVTAPVSAHGGIVAFWDFSENGGSTLGDVSTNGFDGTISGSPSWVAGHLGGTYGDYALQFTGDGAQYVRIPEDDLLHIGAGKAPFTLALWAQDSGSSWGEAFCFGTGGARNFFWQEDGGGTGYLQSQIWAGYTTLSLAGGGWHHIAMSYNGTNIVVYKDGSPVETRGAGTQTAWGDLYIGRASNGIQPWNGKVSDLIILDTAADVTEVGQIMDGTYPGMPALPEEPSNGIWTNSASGGNWSDTGNWASGVVASVGNADFSSIDITTNDTVHLDAPYTIGHLDFGDTDTNTAAGWTLDNNGDVTNVLTVKGNITVNALGAGQDVTLSTVVAGDNGLTKNGPGSLVVTTNICSGNTTLNGGSLTISNVPTNGGFFFGGGTLEYAGDAAPAGTVQASSSAAFKINVTGAGDLTIARVHGNYNGLIKGGSGTLVLANVYQDSGGVQVDEGTIVLAGQSGNALWYSTCNNATVNPLGTLRLGNTQAGLIFYDGGFTMSGGVFDVNGQSPAVNQDHCVPAIVGSGTVVNSATGTIGTVVAKITGTKTFSGNIMDGPNGGKVAVTLAVAAGATPTWVLSGMNTYSGATTINNGTLKADSTTALSSNSLYAVGNNGTLNLASHDNFIGALTGAGDVTLGAATLTIGGADSMPSEFAGVLSGSGSIVKAGTNTLTVSGANTYTGDTTVEAGTLSLAASGVVPETTDLHVVSGARIDLDFIGTNVIHSFYLDGRMQLQTTWGSSSSGARRYDDSIFSGSGVLLVTVGVPDTGTSVVVR